MERKLQTQIIKWLKSKGAYVIKTKPGIGTPVGAPDIFFFYGDAWGAIEVKRSSSAPFQPGQEYTLDLLAKWNFERVIVVYPENWEQIKAQLDVSLFS